MGINTFCSHAPKGLDKEWYLIAEILFSAIASMLATQRHTRCHTDLLTEPFPEYSGAQLKTSYRQICFRCSEGSHLEWTFVLQGTTNFSKHSAPRSSISWLPTSNIQLLQDKSTSTDGSEGWGTELTFLKKLSRATKESLKHRRNLALHTW